PEASDAGGELKACFHTGAHAPGVCHYCCRRIPRDHARKWAPGTTVLMAFDNPIPLSLPYVKGGGGASYFPVSAITDRLYARNQWRANTRPSRLGIWGGVSAERGGDMSKIFISHSSANNAAALAIAEWLRENGWDEFFLDINPARGLAPGERWQEALKTAADRCEAVLFLISAAWRDSRWCQAEFLLAKQLG